MPIERRRLRGRRDYDRSASHRRGGVVAALVLLALSQALLAGLYVNAQRDAKERLARACQVRNQQWDAVITKERALLANAKTLSVISGVREVYEEEIAVLTRTRVDCDQLRANGRG